MTTRMLKGAAAITLAATLAGCQAYGPPPSRAPMQPAPQQMSGIDGEWTDNIATFRFASGQFVAMANDTGNRLVEGSYRRNERGVFELTGYSLLRNAEVRNNCALTTPTQLNCTSATGQQSVLSRRQTMS